MACSTYVLKYILSYFRVCMIAIQEAFATQFRLSSQPYHYSRKKVIKHTRKLVNRGKRNNWFVKKQSFRHVRPAKIQIRLRISAVWSESSLGAFWITKDAKFLHTDNEDTDQTAQMRKLIWCSFGANVEKYHYENTSIQIHLQKLKISRYKLWYFSYFCS